MENRANITYIDHLIPKAEYARLCGVKKICITNRHKNKKLSGIMIDGELFIDSLSTPPVKIMLADRKPLSATTPIPVSLANLVNLRIFCARNSRGKANIAIRLLPAS